MSKRSIREFKVDNDFKVVLGLDEYDKLVTFDFDKERVYWLLVLVVLVKLIYLMILL